MARVRQVEQQPESLTESKGVIATNFDSAPITTAGPAAVISASASTSCLRAANAAAPVVSTPAVVAAPPVAAAPAVVLPAPAMSSDAARTLGSYGHLPMLTKDNYRKWQMAVKAYLIPYDHVRVITQTRGADGSLTDPVHPVDAADLRAWAISEGIAMDIVSGTTYDLHADLVAAHEGGSVLSLWKAIEAQHTNNDSSLRHQAWSLLFGHQMTPDDDLLEYWRRGANVKAHIDCITPRTLLGPLLPRVSQCHLKISSLSPTSITIPIRMTSGISAGS